MKISKILNEKMTFSFEVFPPKEDKPIEPLFETLDELNKYRPDFISVTYGAGGTNIGRSEEVCKKIVDDNMTLMTHFTCIGNSKDDVKNNIKKYVDLGADNVLALRGDLPFGWEGTRGDYLHSDSLIKAIKGDYPDLCLAGACYPEKHIEAYSFDADIAHLRAKQDNGAEFLMCQLCYDLEAYERFIDRIRKAGIKIPIIVGIMPVLFKNGVVRMTTTNGCSIPSDVASIIGKYGEDKEEFKKAGKEYTKELIYKYMNLGIDGLHLYSLNKYKDLLEIIKDTGIRSEY